MLASIPPKTHWPSTRFPRWYFSRPNIDSSTSTITPGPPTFSGDFKDARKPPDGISLPTCRRFLLLVGGISQWLDFQVHLPKSKWVEQFCELGDENSQRLSLISKTILSHIQLLFFWAMDLVATPPLILVCNSCSKSQVHWLAAGWAEHGFRY